MVSAMLFTINHNAEHIKNTTFPTIKGLPWQVLTTAKVYILTPLFIEFLQCYATRTMNGLDNPDVFLNE